MQMIPKLRWKVTKNHLNKQLRPSTHSEKHQILNAGKTSAIWLGNKRNSLVKYMPHLKMEWNPPKFKILGIWFTNDLKECEVLNFSETFLEIRALYKVWLKRQITPLGRVAVLKSLILSKIIHLWMLLPNTPDNVVNELQKTVFQFVWNRKQDRISRKNSCQIHLERRAWDTEHKNLY